MTLAPSQARAQKPGDVAAAYCPGRDMTGQYSEGKRILKNSEGGNETVKFVLGRKIAARGIYRDAVRSSDSHFVKTSGLRWISLMLLTPIPWAQRVWALPVMTVLSPSARYYQQRGRLPKTLLERSVQMLKLLRRWLPGPELIVVGDNAFAALDFLAAAQQLEVTVIARLRLDAALYDPAPPYAGCGRPRKKGQRLPSLSFAKRP